VSQQKQQFNFDVLKNGPGASRLGLLHTPHGIVETPAFIFCATRAAMKSLTVDQLRTANTQIILSNTYHLMLQPGALSVQDQGGLQKFTGWRGPMLTDSGGFQIFSLGSGNVAED
jgi:queuine tRNA-ribosyltransferase